MFLDYFALGVVLVFVVVILFYAVIAIHDIPHLMATARNHPDRDAIHVAGWVGLFTLQAIWPFLFIWATIYRSLHRTLAPRRHHVAILRKARLRMSSWMNYVFLEH
ncbi:DUF3302 domain-containing protein [Rhizobium mongolense]|uniref:DUF3302 domain-containing protein n=1 Tax=Rhizobium mongolense TaxID=57676 RepID=A0A7W6RTT4_9HYPH|nr:DUF3302 domain-containing protein [Rhizobium mongolense]MBB4277951.1 hypothetical protein [Rhizobium mongolense]